MKNQTIKILTFFISVWLTIGCNTNPIENELEVEHDNDELATVHLSQLKFESLGIKVDTLSMRVLSDIVEANGQLKVPPQQEATVTAILGANITSIMVIEGEKVQKGQALGYVSHPNLTQLQINYVKAYSNLQYLEKEMLRQKRLFDEEVGSGKSYQETLANYQGMKAEVKGLSVQLKQLSLNVSRVQKGEIYQYVPVMSPISGFIEKVEVKLGQFVDPQTVMFRIVNLDHIHADLMVFEKDIYKVKVGQELSFRVESAPGTILTAKIYSVGKQFEQSPKALHMHAEIISKEDFLVPGMYISGRIHANSRAVFALPENAIIEEEGKPYIFMSESHQENGETEWAFTPIEIRTGMSDDGWVEVKLLEELPIGAKVAWNNAYYLIGIVPSNFSSYG